MGGDFNSIVNEEERKRVKDRRRGMKMHEFRSFIKEMNLIDVPSIGEVFTWFNSPGSSMSRIDRFLLSDNIVSN